MRNLGLILAFIFSPFAYAGDITGTFIADGDSETATLQYGKGYLQLGAGAGTDFGSGTVSLQIRVIDPSDGSIDYVTVEQYTALPDPSTVALNFGGSSVVLRLNMASSSSPDLDYAIIEARVP